ncbi:Os04g0477850 [Oryza sativa Japonica Group]|uniref:Os04g0477850 protein n=1 Tax=Oryza sativa subsp. japonica TaxID=39947 RepID=A0A0P0WBQ4_ORYSJ|nr:Os04g0477850 [Oryza sativa Japonica Group]
MKRAGLGVKVYLGARCCSGRRGGQRCRRQGASRRLSGRREIRQPQSRALWGLRHEMRPPQLSERREMRQWRWPALRGPRPRYEMRTPQLSGRREMPPPQLSGRREMRASTTLLSWRERIGICMFVLPSVLL